ncbi:MAG: carboxypeptidase-like regulatory domain-containing protein [Planctomycetaceae bacterium]
MQVSCRRSSSSSLFIVVLMACGCGSEEEISLAPVSGTVSLDGQPLPDATVTFAPQTQDLIAPTSFGKTDAQGQYQLETTHTAESGAVPGQHEVRIVLPIEDVLVDGEFVSAEGQLPERYNKQTELTFEVPESGTDQANFELHSD